MNIVIKNVFKAEHWKGNISKDKRLFIICFKKKYKNEKNVFFMNKNFSFSFYY